MRRSAMAEALLEIQNLSAGYGDAVVLEDLSLTLAEGDSLAVLGRNGVGKTSLLATIMGQTRVRSGSMRFRGTDLLQLAPYLRARAGIGWVAQEREIFPSLTVEENLTVAARPGRWTLAAVYELFPSLHQRRGNFGNHLSGGEQQMLAIGRALMTNPLLLLLDEPLEGLAPVIVEELAQAIGRMREQEKMAIILVEQHAEVALRLTANAILLERGRVIHRADSLSLKQDPAALDRFIGLSAGAAPTGDADAATR